MTAPLSYFVGFFFICESEALLVVLLCLLGTEQGNTRESEGLYLECKATLTFENNSVAGGKKNPKSLNTQQYVCDKGWQAFLEVTDYYCCSILQDMCFLRDNDQNVPSF